VSKTPRQTISSNALLFLVSSKHAGLRKQFRRSATGHRVLVVKRSGNGSSAAQRHAGHSISSVDSRIPKPEIPGGYCFLYWINSKVLPALSRTKAKTMPGVTIGSMAISAPFSFSSFVAARTSATWKAKCFNP